MYEYETAAAAAAAASAEAKTKKRSKYRLNIQPFSVVEDRGFRRLITRLEQPLRRGHRDSFTI